MWRFSYNWPAMVYAKLTISEQYVEIVPYSERFQIYMLRKGGSLNNSTGT